MLPSDTYTFILISAAEKDMIWTAGCNYLTKSSLHSSLCKQEIKRKISEYSLPLLLLLAYYCWLDFGTVTI